MLLGDKAKPITESDLPEMEAIVRNFLNFKEWICPDCNRQIACGMKDKLSRGIGKTLLPSSGWNCSKCGKDVTPILKAGTILNAGELSDSFAPEISAQASLRLIELFRKQDRHTLLLVTKSNQVAEILKDVEPTKQVILSFSIGESYINNAGDAQAVSPLYSDRHKQTAKAGWRTRLRLDPLFIHGTFVGPIWEFLPREIKPERITLGSLRANTAHYRYLKNGNEIQRALAALLVKDPDGGSHPYRLPFEQRVEIYSRAIEDLKNLTSEIGICKETAAIYAALGLDPKNNLCNCVP
jgi:DNA repair photolyase